MTVTSKLTEIANLDAKKPPNADTSTGFFSVVEGFELDHV